MAKETELRAGATPRDGASGLPRLLVVDGDPLQASTLAMLLREEGFDALWASPWHVVAESVLDSLDAIIVDVHMPGRNGADVLTRVRKYAPQLPVVVTSGLPEDDPRILAAMALPPVSYICKPIDLPKLLGFLNAACQSARHGARLARSPVENT